ncbi:MAG: hypothetical protein KAG66_15625, partial [Methylococcales bacterium]|nr:hypothetical protein [Methylococcales bacterium]
AAYITPDKHPLKNYFLKRVDHNLDYYNQTYALNKKANKFHIIDNFMINNHERHGKWWMDDFFTWTSKQLVDLDFNKARPIFEWKAQSPIARLTDPGFCWVYASAYLLNFRDSSTGPLYSDMKELYRKNFPSAVTALPCGSSGMITANNSSSSAMGKLSKSKEMVGYSKSATGFPANMQPAIAAAADSTLPNAQKAWYIFDDRAAKPVYNDYPNWAIIPRTLSANMPSTFISKTR